MPTSAGSNRRTASTTLLTTSPSDNSSNTRNSTSLSKNALKGIGSSLSTSSVYLLPSYNVARTLLLVGFASAIVARPKSTRLSNAVACDDWAVDCSGIGIGFTVSTERPAIVTADPMRRSEELTALIASRRLGRKAECPLRRCVISSANSCMTKSAVGAWAIDSSKLRLRPRSREGGASSIRSRLPGPTSFRVNPIRARS